ncbi:MAG: polyprenol monophosphomannose synthase [Elusimicrobiales bacterium]
MKVFVIIPTYNERENIGGLVARVLALPVPAEAVVVDDNSPDGTGALLDSIAAGEPRLHVLHRAGKLGLGTAHIAGLRFALEKGADFAVTMDADLSHDPSYIPALLEAAGRFDLVIGSRYVAGGGAVNSPFLRRLLSRGANLFAKTALGLKAGDCTAGFRCYRASTLRALDLDSIVADGYSFLVEILHQAEGRGFRVGEVPIKFIDREFGASKISRSEISKAVYTVLRLAFGPAPRKEGK